MSSIETRLARQLAQSELLREIVEREPDVWHVLCIATIQTDGHDRWFAYDALKQLSYRFVGFGARKPELRTCQHYDALIDAIDALLPNEHEQQSA